MRCMRDLAGLVLLKLSFCMAPAAGLVAALAFSPAAQAQLLNPFPGYRGPVMNDQDRKLARDALQVLLDQDEAAIGREETWSNPADGRRGSLTMAGSFHRNGMDCRTVRSSVLFQERASPRNFTFRLCHTPSGVWKML
jgi:surface antigen